MLNFYFCPHMSTEYTPVMTISQEKTSLNDYLQFKDVVILEEYLLDNTDFYGCSLKFKARSNTLPLDYRT